MTNLACFSATELHRKLLSREITAREVAEDSIKRIEATEPQLHAFNALTFDLAMKKAKDIDDRIAAGKSVGALAGTTVALKDNLCTRGIPTTCSSKILKNFMSPYNAHVVQLVDEADGMVVGKTNLDEFAMGSSTENSAFGATKNPWNLECAPGGSSGGSSAAVAACQATLGFGSDTGGSIRQPAAFCGIVGLKPTYGRVSRYGLVAFASSLDQIGTFARNIEDTALFLGVISGHDERDSTSVKEPVPNYVSAIKGGVKGLRIGIPKEYFGAGINAEVEKAVRAAADIYKSLGAQLIDISLPHTEYAIAIYYIIATAECSSNLARYDGIHYGHRTKGETDIVKLYSKSRAEGFGPEVKRRIMLGTFALSSGFYDAYYTKAAKVRALVKQDFDHAWKQVDCVLCPTSPTTAFKFGERMSDPLSMYLSDVYTIPANLAGIPGISINCGLDSKGLPIGLQLMTKQFDETTLLSLAYGFESATKHHLARPKI